jgi:uncharacterized RDD family membrane protein YckC
MISNNYSIETAEGIDIDLLPAGLTVRTYAFIIDLGIRFVIVAAFYTVFSYLGDFGLGLLSIVFFLVEWFYPVIFEITKGATPGKSALKLRVIYDNGLPISFAGSLTRNLFRVIDFLPFCYVMGAITMVLNKQSKRLGDMVAGTTVVYANKVEGELQFEFDTDVVDIPKMTTEQQQFVIAFAQRSVYLSKARQIELASVLSPVIGMQGEQAVNKLKSIAALIVGKS